jgi:hypothetical protein
MRTSHVDLHDLRLIDDYYHTDLHNSKKNPPAKLLEHCSGSMRHVPPIKALYALHHISSDVTLAPQHIKVRKQTDTILHRHAGLVEAPISQHHQKQYC